MKTITFVKKAALAVSGVALGGTISYILITRKNKKKKKDKNNKTKNPIWYPIDESIISEEPETTAQIDEDLPWETRTPEKTYSKLSDILEQEGYVIDQTEPTDYITKAYSEIEVNAIEETEQRLAEEESPSDDDEEDEDEENQNGLEYYNPDDDLYDEEPDYIPYYESEDEEPAYPNNTVYEIDEDEYKNSPYETEEYMYYIDVDYFCDADGTHLSGYREVEHQLGIETFDKLKNGQDVIFLRNDYLECCYKIYAIHGEYDQ